MAVQKGKRSKSTKKVVTKEKDKLLPRLTAFFFDRP